MTDRFAPGLGERLLCLLFPARCLECGSLVYPEEFLCGRCREKLVPCRREYRLAGDRVFPVMAPMAYQGGYRETLHQFKFQGYRGDACRLGRLMARQAEGLGFAPEAVAYVPLSRGSRKKRGYDQSRLLAKSVAGALGLPLAEVLEKCKETRTQHQLGREERARNVQGAYRVTGPVAGKSLLLVDDIVTTGATLKECAGLLYRAGALAVGGLCAADAREKPGGEGGDGS